MDMNVLGIPQIYAYVIGWNQYNVCWALIRDTGLFYIPFAVIFGKAVITPFLSQETRSGSVTAVKRLIMDVIYLLIFIYLFAVPAVSININGIHFEGRKNGKVFDYTYNKNNTTYQNHLPSNINSDSDIRMPVMWYVSLNLFNAMVGVLYDSLSADQGSVRQFAQTMQTLAIKDPSLKQEYNRFMNECHDISYADYQNANYPESEKAGIQDLNDSYGTTNLAFAGSKVLERYFYPRHRSNSPVVGFKFNASRDTILAQQATTPKWGRPYCSNWWEDGERGLRDRLYESLQLQYSKEGGGDSMYDDLHRLWGFISIQNEKDAIVENYLMQLNSTRNNNTSTVLGLNTGYNTESSSMNYNPVGSTLSKAGVLVNNVTFAGYVTTLVNMLPLIQMMILMCTFAVIPIGIVLSNFSFTFMMSMFAFVFAVISCTWLWHLVTFADNFFISSLYEAPSVGSNRFESTYQTLSNFVNSVGNANIITVNMVAAIMYLIFPSIITTVITFAGYKVGGAMDSAVSKGNESAKASSISVPLIGGKK